MSFLVLYGVIFCKENIVKVDIQERLGNSVVDI